VRRGAAHADTLKLLAYLCSDLLLGTTMVALRRVQAVVVEN
jgi:hypothetical protein